MKVLTFGKSGQVARELAKRSASFTSFVQMGREEADLLDAGRCVQTIKEFEPDLVINTAAWTDVERAEDEEAAATQVNAIAPGKIAEACNARAIPFVHISTDYVFDGSGTEPFIPTDRCSPLSAYGRSKWLGEKLIRAATNNHLILRTSWVFSSHGKNFVKTILRLAKERGELKVISDQMGGATPASAIAKALVRCGTAVLHGAPRGTYHFAGAPDTSWAGFAREIILQAGLNCAVADIPSSEYPTKAVRPLNSRLDCKSLKADFGIDRPDWKSGLSEVLSEINGEQER